MTVHLCIPPGSALLPYPAVPYLTSALVQSGHDVEVHDLNIVTFRRALDAANCAIAPGRLVTGVSVGDRTNTVHVPPSLHRKVFADFLTAFEGEAFRCARRALCPTQFGASGDTDGRIIWDTVKSWATELCGRVADRSIVGFSTIGLTSALWSVVLANIIKQQRSGVLTVVGGPGVAHWPDFLTSFTSVDLVVSGEGEGAIVEIATRFDGTLRSVAGVPGVGLRTENGVVVASGPSEMAQPLDRLPAPNYSCLPLEIYPQHQYGYPVLPVVGSRGCVGRCAFCSERTLWQSTYRAHSAERVVDDMARLYELRPDSFARFNDSLINADLDRLERLCELILSKGIRLPWIANCRIRADMTPSLLRLMQRAGCIAVWYGLESGDSEVLRRMRKGIGLSAASQVFRHTAEQGIFVGVFVMVGFPGETDAQFRRTCDFISSNACHIDGLHVSPFSLTPGSAICDSPAEFGIAVRVRNTRFGPVLTTVPEADRTRTDALRTAWEKDRKRRDRFPLQTLIPSI